ncbi:MAG TPA: D-aminoacyl-tRNA deacylase [Candidatus Methanoperedens sp.]|nr:D-aminoacyl-tRNA deacylase [Candidatus Methanoperedens sp.]
MKGESKVTIVCSIKDRASQNIKNSIFYLRKWDTLPEENIPVFEYKDFRLVEIGESLIFQDGLDKKLSALGYPASLLIFASKHQSKDMRPILTVHSTGNVNEAKFGGAPKTLSYAAPQAVRSLLRSLKMLAENEEYEVTLECTHHGPSDLDIPSVFIEVGSNETQWLDDVAGRIVAEAILLLKDSDSPVPSHALDELDEILISQAFLRSGADFAYCMQLRKRVKEICPSGKTVITEGIKCALSSCQTCICPGVKIARISPGLLSEAEKLDKNGLKVFLSDHNIAYIEYEDGRFAHILIGLDDSCARLAAEDLRDKCVEIIKKHYDVCLDKGILQISERKFSPKLAKSFGIEDLAFYGKLARGESVIIDGKTINPEMVYETNKRAIKLN